MWAAEPGTAAPGEDFDPRSGVVQFTPGEHRRTVAVPVRADDAGEGTETFRVRFTAAPGRREERGSATATVRLADGG